MARVLIAEDEEVIREVMVRVLAKQGHEVESAADGQEALVRAQEHPFDVLVTDIVMPNMSGLQLIKKILKTMPEIKVVAISGGGRMAASDYLEAAQELSAKTLQKPFSMGTLSSIVNALSADKSTQ